MLAAIGDVVDDVVVHRDGPIRLGTDTPARIRRRRGGSAANVTVTAAQVAGRARFFGQVGDDATGELLLGELATANVDTRFVRRSGRSGAIVVLVDDDGERSFLTDPGSTRDLGAPNPAWLDDVDVLHIPLYSLLAGAIAATSRTLAGWANDRGIPVSVDASSVSAIETLGVGAAVAAIATLVPTAVFANEAEAAALAIDGPVAGAITFVKRGAGPTTVFDPGRSTEITGAEVDAEQVASVVDTTAAGDAFAAGVLTSIGWRDDPVAAARAGHAAAAALLRSRAR